MLQIENREGTLYAKGLVDGKRVNRCLNLPASSMREAKAAIKRIEEGKAKPKEESLAEVAEAYIEWKDMEGRNTGSPDYLYRIPFLVKTVGKTRPSEIDVALLMRTHFKGKAAGTIKKTMNILKAVLRFGVEHGMVASVPSFPSLKVDDARDISFTPSQVSEFVKLVREYWPDHELPALVLVDSGLRVGELCALKWDEISETCITVKKKAAGKAKLRSVPMSKRLLEAVERHRKGSGRLVSVTPNSLSKTLAVVVADCCKRMGVDRLRVHDLRHTFARQCGEAGVDLAELQYLLGHSTISMTVRYRGFLKSRASSVIHGFGA